MSSIFRLPLFPPPPHYDTLQRLTLSLRNVIDNHELTRSSALDVEFPGNSAQLNASRLVYGMIDLRCVWDPRRVYPLFLPVHTPEWQFQKVDSALIRHPRPCRYSDVPLRRKRDSPQCWPIFAALPQQAPAQQALSVIKDTESPVRFQVVYEPLLETGNRDRAVFPSCERQAGVLLVEILVENYSLSPGRPPAGDLLWEVRIAEE